MAVPRRSGPTGPHRLTGPGGAIPKPDGPVSVACPTCDAVPFSRCSVYRQLSGGGRYWVRYAKAPHPARGRLARGQK